MSFRIGRGSRARHRLGEASDEWHIHVVHDTPTPTVDVAAHKQQPSVPDGESTMTVQGAISQVALPTPAQGEVAKAADEIRHCQRPAGLRTDESKMSDSGAPKDVSAPAAPEVRC